LEKTKDIDIKSESEKKDEFKSGMMEKYKDTLSFLHMEKNKDMHVGENEGDSDSGIVGKKEGYAAVFT